MKKPRSLDHDGLDGITPSTDKARLKSGKTLGKADKTFKKPRDGHVPWLLGVIGSLALAVVFVPDLTEKSEAIVETSALNKQTTRDANPASEQLVASANLDGKAPNPLAAAPSPSVAETKPESAVVENQHPQQSGASDREIQTAESFPALPTEPTAAGIPKSAPGNAAQASAALPFTVYFKFDSIQLTSESTNSSTELLVAAKSCRNRIKLNGHTCNLGSDAANLQLGLSRAKAVKKLLVASGIAANTILIASEGLRKPAEANDTKQGQALNRRVELQCVDN
jgi:outer membrane protein OmpA-like peptidoglycan-associated protein